MKTFNTVLMLFLFLSCCGLESAGFSKKVSEDQMELLRLIPEESWEYSALKSFYQKNLLQDKSIYHPEMIFTARDIALITVTLLVKTDEIKDFGLGYYLTFDDLNNLLRLVNDYAGDIALLFSDRMKSVTTLVGRLEKRLNLEVKIIDERR